MEVSPAVLNSSVMVCVGTDQQSNSCVQLKLSKLHHYLKFTTHQEHFGKLETKILLNYALQPVVMNPLKFLCTA